MTAEGAVALIESYDIEAEVQYGSVDMLRQYLDVGRDIILMVDADEIWYGDDDTNPIDAGMDRALVITAIDDVSGIVYLNDPGPAAGRRVRALGDGSERCLDGRGSPDGGRRRPSERGSVGRKREAGGGAPARPGFVLLPIVIAADVLRRVSPWARATGDVSES